LVCSFRQVSEGQIGEAGLVWRDDLDLLDIL